MIGDISNKIQKTNIAIFMFGLLSNMGVKIFIESKNLLDIKYEIKKFINNAIKENVIFINIFFYNLLAVIYMIFFIIKTLFTKLF